MAFTKLEPSGVNTSANFTFANVVITDTITSSNGNIDLGNAASANYFIGNGSLLTGLPSSYSNADVANYLPTYIGNVSANYFIGNGSLLTSTAGGNVTGQVGNALLAGTVYTNAQPNITSTGTLTSVVVSGNANVGNLFVTGNVLGNLLPNANITYNLGSNTQRWKDLYLSGTTIFLGGAQIQASGSDISLTGNLISGNAGLGNIATANYFVGNGSLLTSTAGGNVTGQVGNALLAGTVYTNAQPNITSVGVLSSVTVTGNVSSGNANLGNLIVANYFVGNGSLLTGISGNATNISVTSQSTGDFYPVFVNGNTTGNYLLGSNTNLKFNAASGELKVGNIVSGDGTGGNITGANLISANFLTGTLITAAQPNITSVGVLSSVTITANVAAGNVLTNNLLYANGVAWSFSSTYSNTNVAAYLPTYTGNISANYYTGNGSLLTSINGSNVTGFVPNSNVANTAYSVAGGNVTGQVGNSLLAGTVYTNAQPNITSVGTLTSLTVTSNVAAGNVLTNNLLYANGVAWTFGSTYSNTNVAAYLPTYTGNISANYYTGNGSLLISLTGGNIIGQVGNALIAGTVYTNAQPNITSVGTLTSLTVTGNISSGNANLGNAATANFFIGNGSLLTGIVSSGSSNISNGTSNVNIAASGGNVTTGVGGTANVVVISTSGANITGTLTLGSGTGGNLTGANVISANLFTGTLTTAAQPNITSVGSLASLVTTGNITIGGWTALQESTEVVNTKTGATGTVTHDLSTGAIFYHTSVAANFTVNFTNVPTTADRSITVTLIVAQGATPYIPSAVQIDGAAQTILWFNSTVATGTASKTDFFGFTLLRINTTWYVYGSDVTFG